MGYNVMEFRNVDESHVQQNSNLLSSNLVFKARIASPEFDEG
jgi:hypothetical protein